MPRAGKLGNMGGAGAGAGAPIGNSNAQKNDAETARYICNCKGVEECFSTAQTLKRHKETDSHRILTDPEFAKTEAAKNDAETARYICNCKGVEQPFKTAQSLKRHKESLSHRILTDPDKY